MKAPVFIRVNLPFLSAKCPLVREPNMTPTKNVLAKKEIRDGLR